MKARTTGLWAAGLATVALVGMVVFWLMLAVFFVAVQPGNLTDWGNVVIWCSVVGTVINLAVIVMLGVPALLRSWAVHQRRLAVLSIAGLASLFVLYGPFLFTISVGIGEAGITTVLDLAVIGTAILTFLAVPLSLGFTIATLSATRPSLPRMPRIAAA